ncbi:MAG: carboxymuconolactone decarboxylase family protein [Gammaproteobacteria bacterium]|nr:carboxymuconolactone decarboxylase family protein [Gammaproteobacteria bacterium]
MKIGKLIAVSLTYLVISLPLIGITDEHAPARIPLVPSDTDDPVLKPIFDDIKSRGGEPSYMHRTIGNAPEIFRAFAGVAWAIRQDAILPRVDRELIILRATQLENGEYEFAAHTGMALSCGLTEEQINSLENWQSSDLYTDRQRAILAYADGLASPDSVDEETFNKLQNFFNGREIVELTITANFYTAAARNTNALRVLRDPDSGQSQYGKCE